ncbi:hypothetical protein [Nocardioides perillae]|uniref:Peptidase MA superfamily protein n=1 Tax=Nocardioides perillae TaxID=1119534 RepID=A0A7Y9USF4_9ACTN|nr:hypothetical protein [Nocardioides perillae]NYG55709.1 hypothetical protein [Nocardioides perillae]
MPIDSADAPRSRGRAALRPERPRHGALLLALLLLLAVPGCGFLDGGPEPREPATRSSSAASAVQELLDRQARAVRRGDRAAYAATLVSRGAERRRALRLFANLQALPVARYRLVVDPATVVRTSRGATAVVTTVLRLDGFDAAPVRTPALVRFAESSGGDLVVADHRDPAWAAERAVAPQPWEVSRIAVGRGDGVLVVADRPSAPAVDALVDATEDAVAAVAPRLPYDWDRTVVVYALSDTRVLGGLAQVPGGDPERLDAVSVPVRAAPDGPLAATRVVLHPRSVDDDGPVRDRLLRHEVTHVALAARDDEVPTWLAEGIAEWVSVQPLAPAERTIARSAVEAARDGVDALPSDEDFNGARSAANYGIAWFAVEHLATTYGEQVLWQLVEELRGRDDAAEVDAVLRDVTGLTTADLASAAGTRIVTTFG